MKNILKTITVILVVFLVGCAQTQIVREQPSDHSHAYKNVKVAGAYHVLSFMNRRTGQIGVQILDRYEEPYFLEESMLEAEITMKNGQPQKVMLVGKGYSDEPTQGGGYTRSSTLYSKRFPWVRKAHSALLKVWVPLPDGKTYELSFNCKASEDMPDHSGIIKK
jgi:hypothetical protein